MRDKFREFGEVKFAEIRSQDCGVVRFSKERDAELAISEYTRFVFVSNSSYCNCVVLSVFLFLPNAEMMDGSRFEGRQISVSFY